VRQSTTFSDALLAWYDRHHRQLPWRTPPGSAVQPDPYHIWLSEIMLQQTGVVVVKGYFENFLAKWPSVEELAAADLDDVLRAWAGLGYYARARNLHKCAREVAETPNGRFPRSPDKLIKLPGIGPYTAGAIAAIAFDHPIAAVDGNVERVMARFYAVETPLPDAKPQLHALATELVPQVRSGDYAQAVMDLGAGICAPRKANCEICPLTQWCIGRAKGNAETLPRKRAKKPKPTRYGVCFWVERADGAVLLRCREEKGLLGGMMEVPSGEWSEDEDLGRAAAPPLSANWRKHTQMISHTFTHFHLELEIKIARNAHLETLADDADYYWVERDALAGEALPSVMRKVCAVGLR
jgi:A/G-specific adenine glycosylase